MKHITIFFYLFFLTHALIAADKISISFVGPDSIHIAYEVGQHSEPVWLAEDYSGFTQIMQVSGKGTYRFEPPANGDYRFVLCTNGIAWVNLAITSYDFQGDQLWGYMRYDEEINQTEPTISSGTIIVPESITLSLKRCSLDNDGWILRDFIVSGTLEVTANVRYTNPSWVEYHIYSFQSLAGCVGGEFHFKDGSGGSALTGGTNTTLFANELLTLTGVQSAVLNCGDGGYVMADGCIFNSCAVTGENAAVSLNDSTIAGPCNVTKNATVTADNGVFGSVYLKDSATFTSTQGSLESLLAEASDGSCTMTDTTNGMLHIKELDEGTFARCTFTDRVIVTNAAGSSMSFSDCRMFGSVVATRAASQFNGCDFGGMVQVSTPCAAAFNNCQFLLRLDIGISSASAELPTIENNSFLYKEALNINGDYSLTNVTVPIGANYFGDPAGPVTGGQNSNDEMFKYRGGTILWWPGAQLAPPLRNGIKRDVNDMPVYLWRISQRYGQGTIPHKRVWGDDLTCIKGRETVFVVDVGVNRHTLDNVEFRASYNGTYIEPTRGSSITLYRDYSHLSTLKQEAAQNTINFILPPTTQDYQFVSVEYRLSNTQEFRQVCAESLYFHDAYERKLELNLVPVRLFVLGYSSGTPDAGNFAGSFVQAMSAKTAIARDDIHIWYPRRPYNYIGAFGSLSLTFLLNDIALQLTAGRALISCCNYLSDKDLTIDYTIALLDDGVLKANGVDGASLPLFRNILFTDGDTDALLHEFGHAFGINTSIEQYDEFPKFGKRVAGVSAFVPEPVVLPGFMGDKRRLRHLPGTNLYWYSEKNFFDIMGGTPKNASGDFWPIQDTAYRFHYSLDRLLKTSAAAATAGPAAADTRRIYIQGKTAQKRAGSYLFTYIVPWSLDIMNITEFSGRSEPGPESYENSDYHYQFDGFDSTGGCVYSESFFSGADDAMGGGWQYHSLGGWYRSFDIPDSVVAYRITQLYNYSTREDEKVIWESSAAGPITTDITSPAPGTEIDADFLLSWDGQVTGNAQKQDVPPLRYMVWASVDGGATWQPQTYMTAVTEVNMSYAALPAGTGIIFRVISSDGFSTHSTTLSGLAIQPHSPQVSIMTPLPDARGTTGTCWSLSADVYDPDGDETTNISWYSSLDGFLGAGATVTSCFLSMGTHEIECCVYDASGMEGNESVAVHVTTGVDYALDTNSLWLCSTDMGPYAGPCLSIQTGKMLTVCFQMQSPGLATDIGAVISMTGPGAVTTTLATPAWTNVSAFTPLFHTIDILPEQWGTYTFTAELTGLSPADTVPGDTVRTIQCTTVTPPEIAALRDTVDFVYQTDATVPTGRTVQVFNRGDSPLALGQLTIGGMHATSFTLIEDTLSSSTLAPGATGTVRVIFEPMYVGCNQAYLALPCNDPRRTGYGLDLKGDYLTPEPGACIIVFGLIILLRRRICSRSR